MQVVGKYVYDTCGHISELSVVISVVGVLSVEKSSSVVAYRTCRVLLQGMCSRLYVRVFKFLCEGNKNEVSSLLSAVTVCYICNVLYVHHFNYIMIVYVYIHVM